MVRMLKALLVTLLGSGVLPVFAQSSGTFVQGQITLPAITLIDQHAMPRDLRTDLAQGALLVMTFNYTTCASICPVGNDIMSQLDQQVGQIGGRDVRLLSITIDPSNDTPALMAESARNFDASQRWIWLTGRPGDIRRLLQSVGAPVHNLELHDPVFLVGDGETGMFFRTQTMPDVAELMAMLEEYAS